MKAISMIAAVVLASACFAQYEKLPAVPENRWAFQAIFNPKVAEVWSDLPTGPQRKASARTKLDLSSQGANTGGLRAQASEFAGAAGVLQGTISSETSSTFLIVEAKSKDKTVDARLYLPSRFHRREKETLGYLSLTNRSSQEKLLINGLWANTNIFPDRLDGEPLYKPMVLMFEGPLPTRAQIPVSPGSTLLRSLPLQHLWDFVYTEEGRYKLELIYDDAGLWPADQQRHTVGKIRLGFDLVVEQSIVKFVQTGPKKTN